MNFGLFILVRAVFSAIHGARAEHYVIPALLALPIAITAGIVASTTYGKFLTPRASGRSDSHTYISRAKLASFGAVSVLTFIATFGAGLFVAN